jgi:hypothetical protein
VRRHLSRVKPFQCKRDRGEDEWIHRPHPPAPSRWRRSAGSAPRGPGHALRGGGRVRRGRRGFRKLRSPRRALRAPRPCVPRPARAPPAPRARRGHSRPARRPRAPGGSTGSRLQTAHAEPQIAGSVTVCCIAARLRLGAWLWQLRDIRTRARTHARGTARAHVLCRRFQSLARERCLGL